LVIERRNRTVGLGARWRIRKRFAGGAEFLEDVIA
jgi:hypothetical protein